VPLHPDQLSFRVSLAFAAEGLRNLIPAKTLPSCRWNNLTERGAARFADGIQDGSTIRNLAKIKGSTK